MHGLTLNAPNTLVPRLDRYSVTYGLIWSLMCFRVCTVIHRIT